MILAYNRSDGDAERGISSVGAIGLGWRFLENSSVVAAAIAHPHHPTPKVSVWWLLFVFVVWHTREI